MRKSPLSEASKQAPPRLSDPIPVRLFAADIEGVKDMADAPIFGTDAAVIRWLVHEALPAGKKQFCRNGKRKATA